jgi:ABC-type glycerol-3-phosphate transport system substrate-binding protein
VGNVLNLTNNYGMSSSCKNKEAAWQFLRGLLTMDSQRFYGLPTNKNLFEQKMKAAMTPEYEEDENGNIRLDENGAINPDPQTIERIMRKRFVPIFIQDALIVSEHDDTHMTIFNADDELLELVGAIATSEGLFVWNPGQGAM